MNVRLIRIVPALVFFVLVSLLIGRDQVLATQADLTVRWEGVSANLLKGEEPAEPFTRTFPDIPPENLKWQLYAGELGEAPRQLYETRRWLRGLAWSADGLRMGVHYSSPHSYPEPSPRVAGGVLSFDSANPTSLPTDLGFEPFVRAFDVLPGGSKVLLADSPVIYNADINSYVLPPPFEPPPLLMVDAERMTAFTPIGLEGRVTPGADRGSWSPDGAYVLLTATGAPYVNQGPPSNITACPCPPTSVYSVSTADGTARLVMTAPASNEWSRPAWSPAAPYLAAFISEGALWVFNPRTGSRRLTPDNIFRLFDQLIWHDAQHVWMRDKLVNVTTGDVRAYDFGQPSSGSQPSPDGRYAVTFAYPIGGDNEPLGCDASKHDRPQNKLALYDRATGSSTPLKDCDGRAFTRFQWLSDNRHVVMTGASTACCHGGNWLIVLKDVVTGAEVPLTRGYEAGAQAFVSPDGNKVIVGGDKLRVYDTAGTLLQEKDPPTGLSITFAAWAPDSKRFTFVAGPTGVSGF